MLNIHSATTSRSSRVSQEDRKTIAMTQDQSALQKASDLMERVGRKPTTSLKIARKVNRIANRSGLSTRTRNVIRYAIQKCKEGSANLAWRVLMEEHERQLSGEDSDFTADGKE